MAAFGANYPCFKPEGETAGVVLGKLVSANLTVNLATGELFADDALAEHISEFSSGSLAMQTDDLEDDKAAKVYGCKVAEKKVTYNIGDTAPYGGLGYYKALSRGGKKYFKGIYHPRVRAALGNDNAQTKGSSITFQAENINFTVLPDGTGNWRITETFDTPAAAQAWVQQQCGLTQPAQTTQT